MSRRAAAFIKRRSYGYNARIIGAERTWFTRESAFADGALLATIAAVAVLFGVSQITLEAFGYNYISAGGPFWQKVHPATPIAAAAFGLRCLASGRPLKEAGRLAANDAGAILLLIGVTITAVFAGIVVKVPVTPLIDTFVLPILFFWLLRDLDEQIARKIALGLALFLAINALVAMGEFLTGWRLITVSIPDGVTADPTRSDAVFDWRASLSMEWRATALLGHPIESGAVVGAFIGCLAVPGNRWMPAVVRVPLLALQIMSMAAYGSRLSLVLSLMIAAAAGLHAGARRLMRGVHATPRTWVIIACAVPVAIGAVFVLFQSGLFDRTIDRFSNDAGSASTRVTMLRLFEPLSLSDMLFGPNADVVQTWKRLEGLEFGIESSWIGLILTYGLIVSAILVFGLAAFTMSIIKVAGRGAWAIEAFFMIVLSLSTGLSGKTTILAIVTVLILLFLRRDERGLDLPATIAQRLRRRV